MSRLILRNNTLHIAMFVVRKGEQVVARIPGLAPGAQLQIPTTGVYRVMATTMIEGNTYTSAPMDVSGATGFLARVVQVQSQGTYEFDIVQTSSTSSDQLQFQKTCPFPVTFAIARDGVPMQAVVVTDSFEVKTLDISDTFYIHAVVNGVTTSTVATTNPDAVITAVVDTSHLEQGYFTLDVA